MEERTLDVTEWPEELRKRAGVVVHGVFVGVCVQRVGAGIAWRRSAHAHVGPGDNYAGWLCFRSPKGLADVNLVRHELAHLLTGPGHRHDDKFRERLAELHGGELPKGERKIPRQSGWWCRGRFHGKCWGKVADIPRFMGKRCLCWCHRKAWVAEPPEEKR